MPLSETDILWEATGHTTTSTTHVVTHPDAGGTTAGSTVLVFFRFALSAPTVTGIPAGFVADLSSVAYRYSNTGAGETSWTFTLNLARNGAWYLIELDGLDLVDPLDTPTVQTNGTNADGTTRSTNTTAVNVGSETIAFAIFTATKVGAGDVQSWSGYTNGFAERADFAPAGAGEQIAIATKINAAVGQFESTATFATTGGTPATQGRQMIYRAADASINAPLGFLTGFEFGTHGGLGSTTGPLSPSTMILSALGTWGTGYSVAAGSARDGSYGLKVVGNNAEDRAVPIGDEGINQPREAVAFDVKMESATGQVLVAYLPTTGATSADLQVYYDASTTQFGLKWVGGTTVWQTGTTALDTWALIDIRMRTDSSVYHADWRIETGTGDGHQTSPTDPTGQTTSTQNRFYLGTLTGGGTFTAHYDNAVRSRYYAAYPLGPHPVRLLVPETTGASVSGTAANFNQFTSNGTLAAFASTNGALLDEVPPTVSASADGVVQVTAAASDYMEFPMATYATTSQEIIAGVRMVAVMWGTGAGTIGIRGYDGTTETVLAAIGSAYTPGTPTAASATAPVWRSAMWPGGTTGSWNQTRLDAAALRVGFSTDATPDMGVSALYLEVATRPTPIFRQVDIEDGLFTVDLRVDPYNSASVSYLLESTDATRGATFSYSISGTPQTPVVVAASTTEEVVVNAAEFGEISDLSLEPDAP